VRIPSLGHGSSALLRRSYHKSPPPVAYLYPQIFERFPIRSSALRLKSRAMTYELDLRRLDFQSTQVDFVNVASEFIRRAGLVG
jgi:hypothetical protein